MKVVEHITILLILMVVLAHQITRAAGQWTGSVRLGDLQLQLAIDIVPSSVVRFQGRLSQSSRTITDVEIAKISPSH